MQVFKIHAEMKMDFLVQANTEEEATQRFYDNIIINDDIDTDVDVFTVTKQE